MSDWSAFWIALAIAFCAIIAHDMLEIWIKHLEDKETKEQEEE